MARSLLLLVSTMSIAYRVCVAAVASLVLGGSAYASPVVTTEGPDHETESTVLIDAPPAQIYAWCTDYAHWPQLLRDVKASRIEAGGRADATVRFRSVALGHEVAFKFENVENRRIRFHSVGTPTGVTASGSLELVAIDEGRRTRVVATLYVDVSEPAAMLTSNRKLRVMRQTKLRSDLGDLIARFSPEEQVAAR